MEYKLKYPVITISREYCAFGRTVAAALAEKLGIKYYDKDFIYKTVIESGFPEDVVKEESEAMSSASKFLEDMLGVTASYSSSFDKIFEAQRGVILKLAEEGPCILVGRCANVILRDAGIESFNIYLHADIDIRKKRCSEIKPEMTDKNLEKYIKKIDNDRRIYFRRYAGSEVDDPRNYNICLDVGRAGIDKTVETILSLAAETCE